MLKTIELHNFLSYQNQKVDFSSNATIAVLGENGHGKSGLLEAILFCLYGEGRDDLSRLVRIGSNGEMSVILTMKDVPKPNNIFVVERGVKKSGNGYTKVSVNDSLISQGGAKYSNNPAQEYINEVLGIDKDSFLLTAFFGLGSNDSLMQVPPSTRLDTLQNLASIDICSKFNKTANDYAKSLLQEVRKNEAVLKSMKENNPSIKVLEKSLAEEIQKKKELTKKLEEFQQAQNELIQDETKYQNLINELQAIRGKYDGKIIVQEKLNKNINRFKADIKSLKNDSGILLRNKQEYTEMAKSVRPLDKLSEEYNKVQNSQFALASRLELINNAKVDEDAPDRCPLCGHDLEKDMAAKWENERISLKNRIDGLIVRRDKLLESMKTSQKATRELEKINSELSENGKELQDLEKELSSLLKEHSVLTAEIDGMETKIVSLNTEIKSKTDLVNRLKLLSAEIEKRLTAKGRLTESIANIKKQILSATEVEDKMKILEKEIKEQTNKMNAYNAVADAFSRYAIPVKLLQNLRDLIEKKASRIYQYFTNGSIRIEDVEGARPGVEFVLYDDMGTRAYKALSMGEKVMVFLAIRVAIMQIINSTKDNKVEFLILDEIAGNLSPTRREALTRLINSFLRKFFTQIFMVSHVELRDIFNETLLVKKENGISKVEVSY